MNVSDILTIVKTTKGTNEKKRILSEHADNKKLRKALLYGLDPFTPFNIVKIPKVKSRLEFPLSEDSVWQECFTILDECATREVTGNAAIDRVYTFFSSISYENELWIRKILKKHLAIGVSTKTVNKVFPGLVKTFEVSLAHKFDWERIKEKEKIVIEPKLDGIRCFSIVRGDSVQMFARSGKLITNFQNTLAPELAKLGDGCYDGELMGQDFISLMRQAYRKDDVDTSKTYLSLFDFLPLGEWDTKNSKMTCHERFEELLDRLNEDENLDLDLLRPVERDIIETDYSTIKDYHDEYVKDGYEGAMIKDPSAPYKFGRGNEVMKLKVFHDVDLPIEDIFEGTGKHSGKLGAVKVVFNGVDVQVGSGFSDELRDSVWNDKESFIGRIVEVRYQEVTPDGSLRFPTFVCFRNDR